MSADSSFQSLIREKNTSSLRLEALLGVLLVPLFWLLDLLVVPEHVWTTGVLRLGAVAYGLWILYMHRRNRGWLARHVDLVTVSFTLLVGFSISAMCWLHHGLDSPYYAGLSLLVVSVGFLFAWPLRLSLYFFGALYGVYVAPVLFTGVASNDFALAVGNQFFLVSMMVVTVWSQRHRYQMEQAAFRRAEELRDMNESLRHAYARLKELDQAKTRFFNNITHELRTPLTMILSPLESILSGDLGSFNDDQKSYLRLSWQSGLKLLKLINDLLDLARMEEHFAGLAIRRQDPAQLVGGIVEHAMPLARRKNITLVGEMARVEPIPMDWGKMERVVVNLVSNALKFTPEGGVITVSVEQDEEETRLEVADTGPGIAADKQALVFQRFCQADEAVTRRFGGSGIGLSLARQVVELHGGRISLESEEGSGSTFTVHLPFHGPDCAGKPADEAEEENGEPREWTRQLLDMEEYRYLELDEVTERRVIPREDTLPRASKILVVEDNPAILQLVHLQLREEHRIFAAQDGRRGLELARRELPDAIVTDYMMPEMDGIAMIRELKSHDDTRYIPVVMLSAKSQVEDRLAAMDAGADLYLAKPFSPKELRSAVRQLLEKRGLIASVVVREQVRSLEVISAALAHEINNPLSYLKSALFIIGERVDEMSGVMTDPGADLATRRSLWESTRPKIERMRRAADNGVTRLEKVVKLVRRYASEGRPREAIPMNLDAAVSDVGRLVSPKDGKEVSVTLSLEAGDASVCCHPEEMQQVITNLWQNALDAVAPGGSVAIRTRRGKNEVVFEVQDDGPGIPAQHLGRIFTPFYTTKDVGEGMGLGLPIVAQVVHQTGGVVQVESREGHGSTFRVRLPLAPGNRKGAA